MTIHVYGNVPHQMSDLSGRLIKWKSRATFLYDRAKLSYINGLYGASTIVTIWEKSCPYFIYCRDKNWVGNFYLFG